MKTWTRRAAWVVVALTTGCATLLNPDRALVRVPDGATVTVNGVPTPTISLPEGTSVPLLNSLRQQVVVVSVDGQPDRTCQFFGTVGTVWVVLDILFGLVPLVVDMVTDEWRSVDPAACASAFWPPDTGR